ncbi:ABC transporter substrate-binding protein [Paenibacillus lemnae]|uniref:ABC transporter substrate-binding protein n=1 Tax=Paenibacillus lemnae TaxID=1330551 RepID=A0A848M940_PAELE|nr:ABC transporter substrate-binding protein [Paenibacillus lemnae]NMO96403.1 ABC transporter substrate-binding protein [Paenibacillus lemnae]
MNLKKSVFSSLLGLSLLAVTACGSDSAAPADGTDTPSSGGTASVKVGLVCGGMTPLLTQIAINDGSFEKENLKVEKTCFNSGADAVQALVGGSIDINLGSYEHVLRQQKNGLGVKAYGEIYNGVGYSLVVKKDAPYQSIADVKDQVLAVTKVGSLSDTGLRAGLEGEGLNPETDAQIINGGSGATMLAAIESGKAAGGMVSEPTISQMLASGDYRVLYDPPFEYAGIVVMAKTDWVEQNQEAMKSFLKVNKEVFDRAKEDPQSVVEPMKNEFEQLSDDVLLTAIENQLAKIPADLKVTKEAADMVAGTQIELGAISEEIPFEETVDLTLLP